MWFAFYSSVTCRDGQNLNVQYVPGESKKKYTRLMSHKKVTIVLILEI